MFRLEKVFQNDDSGFILFLILVKTIILLISTYIFVILSNYSIYELADYKIFNNSNYFYYSIIFSTIYFILSFFLKNKKEYKQNFISFLREDVLNIFFSIIFTFAIIFVFGVNFKLEAKIFLLLI